LKVGGNFSKSGRFISKYYISNKENNIDAYFVGIEALLLSQADIEAGDDITFPLVTATNISYESFISNSLIRM